MQRAASVRTPEDARKTGIFASILVAPIGILAAYGGLVARVHLPIVDPKLALPTVILENFSPIVGGLFCAAILAACMSCSDSWIHASATMIVRDVYLRWLNPNASDKKVYHLSMLTCLFMGLASLLLAMVWKRGIIMLVTLAFTWKSALYIGPLLSAWFSKKKLSKNMGFFIIFLTAIVGTLYSFSEKWLWGLHPCFIAVLVSYTLTLILLALNKRR